MLHFIVTLWIAAFALYVIIAAFHGLADFVDNRTHEKIMREKREKRDAELAAIFGR